MKKYEFTGTNELTRKAFEVYSDSSFTFWKGSLEDVNEFLERFAE